HLDGERDLSQKRRAAPGAIAPAQPVRLRKRAKGTFKPSTEELKITGPAGGTVVSVFADFDADRDIDAVLSSLGGQDTLLDNRREDGFAARGREAGLNAHGSGRGLAAGDVDGDGLPDLVFAGEKDAALRLLVNGARRIFTERTIPAPPGASLFGVVLFDADND